MAQNRTGTPTVVITGASTGIGEACALRLDKAGWRVFAGVRKEADGQRLKGQASDRLTPISLDVTNQAEIDAAVQTVSTAAGAAGLQGVVNNAGVSVNGPLEYLTSDDLRKQLEVNVIGQIAVTRSFLELIRQGHGRIVFIGSIAGKMATPFLGPYCASKHAMEALSDSLRQELRPWGISVSLVEPGSIATSIWGKGLAEVEEYERNIPEQGMQRYGKAITALKEAVHKFEAAGIPADRVAKPVEHALTSGRPRTRYIVGFDASVQSVLRRVAPDRLRDRLVAMQLKLPTKAGHITFACGTVLVGTYLATRTREPTPAEPGRPGLAALIDYRFVALGALLPDLIDKPLGRFILKDFFDDNGHVIGHTLLFGLVLVVLGVLLAVRSSDVRLLCLGIGDLTHLAVDPVTHAPQILFWPLLGTDFPQVTLLGPWATVATEAAAGLILATFVVLTYRAGRLPTFVRIGRI